MQLYKFAALTAVDADGHKRRALGPADLPIACAGERIAIRLNPVDEVTDSGIVLPKIAQVRPYSGRIVDAGLQALDKMWDAGIELGDEIWFAKFAGVTEEWDHVIEGQVVGCDHGWARAPAPREGVAAYVCDLCGAKRLVEPLIIANVDDVLGSVEQAERLRAGKLRLRRGQTADGRTTHYYERAEEEKAA